MNELQETARLPLKILKVLQSADIPLDTKRKIMATVFDEAEYAQVERHKMELELAEMTSSRRDLLAAIIASWAVAVIAICGYLVK